MRSSLANPVIIYSLSVTFFCKPWLASLNLLLLCGLIWQREVSRILRATFRLLSCTKMSNYPHGPCRQLVGPPDFTKIGGLSFREMWIKSFTIYRMEIVVWYYRLIGIMSPWHRRRCCGHPTPGLSPCHRILLDSCHP